MDEMQVLGNFGAKYTLEWKGKTYSFSFIGDQQKSWYVKCMKQGLMDAIEQDESSTEAEKRDERFRVKELAAAGEFRWGGKRWETYRAGPEGQIRLLWMLLALEYSELTRNDIERMMEDKPKEIQCIMSLVWADSMINSVKGMTESKKQIVMEELYARLIQPPEAGGMGIPVDIVAQFTDRQKDGILNRNLQTEASSPKNTEALYTQEDKKKVEKMLREYATNGKV